MIFVCLPYCFLTAIVCYFKFILLLIMASLRLVIMPDLKSRMDDEMEMDNREYISRRRSIIQKQGLRIVAAISSQLDILTSFHAESQNFKLPNLMYSHKMNHEMERKNLDYE